MQKDNNPAWDYIANQIGVGFASENRENLAIELMQLCVTLAQEGKSYTPLPHIIMCLMGRDWAVDYLRSQKLEYLFNPDVLKCQQSPIIDDRDC